MLQKQLPLQIKDAFNKYWLGVFYILLLLRMWPLSLYAHRSLNHTSKYGYRYISINENDLILTKDTEETVKININEISKILITEDAQVKNRLVFNIEIVYQNQSMVFDSSCLGTLRILYHQLRPYIDFEFNCSDVWYQELNSNGHVSKQEAIIISIIFLSIIFLLLLW